MLTRAPEHRCLTVYFAYITCCVSVISKQHEVSEGGGDDVSDDGGNGSEPLISQGLAG